MALLALDHLTVGDCGPLALVEVAHAAGARAVGLFLHAMDVLPHLPRYDLVADRPLRRETRARAEALGVGIDLAYPFTLTGRTEVATLLPALDCAAEIGAARINMLVYDRDPARRADRFAALCEAARGFELGIAVEFFPASQVRTLADALALVRDVGGAGVNVDLLHLVRSGGTLAELAAAPCDRIACAQLCDGPADCPPDARDREASAERLLPGDGAFDLAGFVHTLPPACPLSVEVPRDGMIAAGVPAVERARLALAQAQAAIS